MVIWNSPVCFPVIQQLYRLIPNHQRQNGEINPSSPRKFSGSPAERCAVNKGSLHVTVNHTYGRKNIFLQFLTKFTYCNKHFPSPDITFRARLGSTILWSLIVDRTGLARSGHSGPDRATGPLDKRYKHILGVNL